MLRGTEKKVNLEDRVPLSFGESYLERHLLQEGWCPCPPSPAAISTSILKLKSQTML